MDQAVGLRQEQIQVLQRRRVRREKKGKENMSYLGKKAADQMRVLFFLFFFPMRFLTEASSPDRTPGFLLRSRCSRLLEYSSLEHRA